MSSSLKSANYKAESIMNTWSVAEMGAYRAKKIHKKSIRRQRRVLEKRLVEKMASAYL